ncbi:MAG TPA: FMN-binding protein [Dehalococcoidia bacterium]|nr:FMN-binding protein [Dehalococcoidia bacterium]
MEKFGRLLPEIAQIKPVAGDTETICWEAYDKSGLLVGYAFAADVPEAVADVGEMQEMDKYQVFGIVDPKEYKIIALDITIHPAGPEEPWATEITEPEFEKQYIGLTVEEIDLSPDGKIDAITDSTLSSTWVTNAIREKVQGIIKKAKG